MKKLSAYSIGVGDRFAHQAKAQLAAIVDSQSQGIEITPVWNKSYREHQIIQSSPKDTRKAADQAVTDLNFTGSYYLDADHINKNTVDIFMDHSDFFTLDVADFINQAPPDSYIQEFIDDNLEFLGNLYIPGVSKPYFITPGFLEQMAKKYLLATVEARHIYEKIKLAKGPGTFITEVSMDEVDDPQSPIELFFILKLLKDIPVQTIAPKFVGQFYKGVDYIGNLNEFQNDLDQIFSVLTFAKKEFHFPEELKISIHSGSDKFSLYPVIKELMHKHQQGIHLKTAGTTWLEELIGLSLAGSEGLQIAREIYTRAYKQMNQLCAPYKNVVHIDRELLPRPSEVSQWEGLSFANALRHDPNHSEYNTHFRQLMHVGYKIAAQMGDRYINVLRTFSELIAEQVYENIFERHIKRIFI